MTHIVQKNQKLWDIGDITKTAKGAWAYYAKGTKNFGIGGENYKTEYLRNKKTGEWHEINEPTLVNTDEYDVIGEKTSAKIKQIGKPLPMYATGTPISDPKVREMVKKSFSRDRCSCQYYLGSYRPRKRQYLEQW